MFVRDGGPGTALVPAQAPPFELEPDDGTQRLLRPSGLRDRRYRRRHGVAPFVRPASRRSRRKRRRDYRKLGFIELTQEKLRLRHRILPRTVIGISLMILALGVGAAFAGAALYAYYDYRQTQNETRVDAFADGFEKQYAAALGQLQGVRDQAIQSVNDGLGPLQAWQDDADALIDLPSKVGGGVWTLRTLDSAGRPVIGSAFVVSSDANSSLLLTSYETVSAATAQPGPAVTVEKGGEQLGAELYRWDAPSDLALLRVAKGNMPPLTWAPEPVRAQAIGKHVYAVSGLGGAGAKATRRHRDRPVQRRAPAQRPDQPGLPGRADRHRGRPGPGGGDLRLPTARLRRRPAALCAARGHGLRRREGAGVPAGPGRLDPGDDAARPDHRRQQRPLIDPARRARPARTRRVRLHKRTSRVSER